MRWWGFVWLARLSSVTRAARAAAEIRSIWLEEEAFVNRTTRAVVSTSNNRSEKGACIIPLGENCLSKTSEPRQMD